MVLNLPGNSMLDALKFRRGLDSRAQAEKVEKMKGMLQEEYIRHLGSPRMNSAEQTHAKPICTRYSRFPI